MAPWPPINRDDLRHAAGSAGFDATFPILIRRLIAETGGGVTDIDMPGGSGTATGGFDGVVTATRQTTFVPEGTSVWEASVTVGAQTKADTDYSKRHTGPDGMPTSEVTYVQVILAPWTKARTWATQRNKEGRWKHVLAYNLDRLDIWLERAPATTAWLAEQIGKAIPGVRPVENWWMGTWLPSTRVPLGVEVVLAGREATATAFLDLLAGGRRVVTLGGDLRLDEARAFVAASFEHAGTAAATVMRARSLFVSDTDSLAQLLGQAEPLILLLSDPVLAADLPMLHPHQLVMLAPVGGTPDLPVPPVDGQAVAAYLQAAGMSSEQAHSLGTLARRSVLALRRALAMQPAVLTPMWASTPDVTRRRLLLLGAWDGANDNDRHVLEDCVGRPYGEVEEAALALAAAPEVPFLGRRDERWHLLSPTDAWTLLSPHLSRDDLEAFRKAVREVLTEHDPVVVAVAPAERWKAGLTGVRRGHSSDLRQGLAQTLALLGSSEATVKSSGGSTGSEWVQLVVREILAQANADGTYVLWTSLGDVLGLIAEAAPEEFLQAMFDGLEGQQPLHQNMFADADVNAFGQPMNSPHVNFLTALELLAWSPDYVDDVVDVLGRLAAIDPGGRWSNRPGRSLAEILSCWHPNTAADDQQRIRALERLLRAEPEVGRRLLVELIPDAYGFQTAHHGPRFRGWKHERPVTPADQQVAVTTVTQMLLDDLDEDPDKYLGLIEKLDHFSPAHRTVFSERLAALGASLNDEAKRTQLFEAIRDKIAHHREYADTSWALPENELRSLQTAGEALEPRSAIRRLSWLFASDWVTLGDLSRREDFHAYDAEVNQRRADAVDQVLAEGGLSAVTDLAASTQFPHLVGVALAQNRTDLDADILAWLQEDQPSRRDVAFAYFVSRLRQEGPSLRDDLLRRTADPLTQARVLRATFDPPSAWEKLPELTETVAEHYWREFTYFGLGTKFEHALAAARALTEAGRHAAALDLIALYEKRADSPEAAEIVAKAFEGLLAGGQEDPEVARLSRHEFERLFALLSRHRDTVGRHRVINIEWQLFPALGFQADAPTLHAALAEDPAFFVELVGYVYRPGKESEDTEGDDGEGEQRRLMAGRGYEVLRTWRRCPGVRADGTIDADALRAWATEARERLVARDRLQPGDSEIGQALASAPPDADGLFPPKAVRDLLEDLRSDRIDGGLRMGIFNQRGVTSRGLLDGGVQELELAKGYREQDYSLRAWPRTRKLLRALAEGYERDARREDEEAERRRRGLND